MSIPADCLAVRLEQGGQKLNVPTGSEVEVAGTHTVASGGTLAVASGATASLAGTLNVPSGGVLAVASGGSITVASGGSVAIASGAALTGKQVRHRMRSPVQDVDNGAGTTVDHVILVPTVAITVVAASVNYTEEVAGTVAGATAKIGTTAGGEQIVAGTALVNTSAVGATQALTLVTPAGVAVAAGTPVMWRHTGIAATAAGKVFVEIDYTIDA